MITDLPHELKRLLTVKRFNAEINPSKAQLNWLNVDVYYTVDEYIVFILTGDNTQFRNKMDISQTNSLLMS
jgi:hypothetical protein